MTEHSPIRTIAFLLLLFVVLGAAFLAAGTDDTKPGGVTVVVTDTGGVEPLPSPETPTETRTLVDENPDETYDACNRTCN